MKIRGASYAFFFLNFILLCYWSITVILYPRYQHPATIPQIKTHKEELKGQLKRTPMSPEERQSARKRHLKEFCLQHAVNRTLDSQDLFLFAVDDKLKLLYCVIPKVASTTWTSVLANAHGIKRKIGRWTLWRHLSTYSEEERSHRLRTYFKFVFVREPYQRLLSAYKDKFITDAGYTKDIRKNISQTLRPQNFASVEENFVRFSEFIQYFSQNITRNKHRRQYEKLCHPCAVNYDFIGHFETMKEDAALLLRMIDIDHRRTFPSIHEATARSEVLEYYSQVPALYITRLAELYRNDFEMFGYDYIGPLQQLLNQSVSL